MKIALVILAVIILLGLVVIFSSMPGSSGWDDDYWY